MGEAAEGRGDRMSEQPAAKMPIADQRIALEIFIADTLRMMKLSGALVEAAEQQNRYWCIQFEGGDPQLVSHSHAMLLASGFRLGISHYHAYKTEMREITQSIAEEVAQEASG